MSQQPNATAILKNGTSNRIFCGPGCSAIDHIIENDDIVEINLDSGLGLHRDQVNVDLGKIRLASDRR